MVKQNQTMGENKKQSLRKSKPEGVVEHSEEPVSSTDTPFTPDLLKNSTIQTQAGLLNDGRFRIVQRQGMAIHIDRVAGNQYLQRVMAFQDQGVNRSLHISSNNTTPLLSRENEGGQDDQQNALIPQELQERIDVALLSDEELRRRSELIIFTLGKFDQKTPATQRLEDELVQITTVISKRPSDLGKRIIENYEAAEDKAPGGACIALALKRVKQAYRDIFGEEVTKSLPEGKTSKQFDRLANSHIVPKKVWLTLPEEYRGKGLAGAMAFAGKGTLIEQAQIWSGALLPGAVLQTWELEDDFERVKEGKAPEGIGHSFIFMHYNRKNDEPDGDIEGMDIADNGYQSEGAIDESAWGYWVAANVTGNLPSASGIGAEELISSLLSGKNTIKGGESHATNFNILGGGKFKLDTSKIVAEIKTAAADFDDENLKKAINSLNPDRFNVYFTQLVALYQLGLDTGVDGRFGDGTCKKLVGKPRNKARSLRKV